MPPDRCREFHFRQPDEVVGANCVQRSYTYDIRCETVRHFRDPTVRTQGSPGKLFPLYFPVKLKI